MSVFTLHPVTEQDVIRHAAALRGGSAPGFHGISANILKDNMFYFSNPILHLVNLSVATGKRGVFETTYCIICYGIPIFITSYLIVCIETVTFTRNMMSEVHFNAIQKDRQVKRLISLSGLGRAAERVLGALCILPWGLGPTPRKFWKLYCQTATF